MGAGARVDRMIVGFARASSTTGRHVRVTHEEEDGCNRGLRENGNASSTTSKWPSPDAIVKAVSPVPFPAVLTRTSSASRGSARRLHLPSMNNAVFLFVFPARRKALLWSPALSARRVAALSRVLLLVSAAPLPRPAPRRALRVSRARARSGGREREGWLPGGWPSSRGWRRPRWRPGRRRPRRAAPRPRPRPRARAGA